MSHRKMYWLGWLIILWTVNLSNAIAHDLDFIEPLIRQGSATHVARSSGNWSATTTWTQGTVPGADSLVRIPTGLTVEYDILPTDPRANIRIGGIRIEGGGELHFAHDRSVKLTVDTIIGLALSAFTIGTEQTPLLPNNTVEIVWDSGGVGSYERRLLNDPKQFGIGAVFVGNTVKIYGAKKTAFLLSTTGAVAGANQITVVTPPQGWLVGDSVIVTATYAAANSTTQELRTLTAINGAQLTLSAPLSESHLPGVDQVPVYVANLSRNVVMRSKNGEATATYHRGHMMMMDPGTYMIQSVELVGMGRTDKNQYLDGDGQEEFDGDWWVNFKLDANGVKLPGLMTNIKGRYPLHFHFVQLNPELYDPAIAQDCVVRNSPGWGMAVHESFAQLLDNVSYDVRGAHYVAEDGNELGEFSRNIGIQTRGPDGTLAWHKGRAPVHDFAHINSFWFQGRGLAVIDNVAVGNPKGEAFMWFHRSNLIKPMTKCRDIEGLPIEACKTEANLSFTLDDVPLLHVSGNTVVGAKRGMMVIKSNPDQGFDFRSQFSDTRIYNVEEFGAHFEYTSRYTIENFLAIHQAWKNNAAWNAGLEVGNNSYGFTIKNSKVKGFGHAFYTPDTTIWTPPDTVDLMVVDAQAFDSAGAPLPITVAKLLPSTDWTLPQPWFKFYQSSELLNRLIITDPAGYDVPWPATGSVYRTVTKQDSLPLNDWTQDDNYSIYSITGGLMPKGHFTLPDGRKWLPLVMGFQDRVFRDRTTFKLWRLILPANRVSNKNGLGSDLGVPDPPVVSTQPVSIVRSVGETANFSCVVNSELIPVNYRWTKNGQDIPNSRYPTLRIPHIDASYDGAKIRCAGCNYFGCAASDDAILTMTPPAMPGGPVDLRICSGSAGC